MYQPPSVIHDSRLTRASAGGLRTANKLLIEKWELLYPFIPWKMLDLLPQAAVVAGAAELSSTPGGGTVFDPLYGEAVPVDASGNFTQPHGDSSGANTDATARTRYKTPINVPLHIRREKPENPLTEQGEDASRKYTIVIPTAVLDKYGVVANVGDRLTYHAHFIEIYEVRIPERGYWKHTNIPMYIEAKGAIPKIGS